METLPRSIWILLVTIMVSITLIACGDDDKKEDFEPPGLSDNHDSKLIGTWTRSERDVLTGWDRIYIFHPNGHYTYSERYWLDEEDEIICTDSYTERGLWKTDETYLLYYVSESTKESDRRGSGRMEYSIKGDILFLDGYGYLRDE